MKLSKEDIKILTDWGCTQQDIKQIKSLRYKFTLCYENGKEEKISTELARKKLSQKDFLSGIERAAFHRTSYRETQEKEPNGIYIKSNLSSCF